MRLVLLSLRNQAYTHNTRADFQSCIGYSGPWKCATTFPAGRRSSRPDIVMIRTILNTRTSPAASPGGSILKPLGSHDTGGLAATIVSRRKTWGLVSTHVQSVESVILEYECEEALCLSIN